MITLSDVTKTFDGKRTVTALEHVSLAIERGEMVSIVGASGSGKSTLLNLIGALDRPTSGWIEVDGRRLDGLGDDELTKVRRDTVGFIFQFFNLLPTLSCLENVALPLHLRGWARKKAADRARELLGLVQLEKRIEHLPDELSGGERQRVAIARALVTRPACILADEPTGNLDRHTAHGVFDLMRNLNRKQDTSLIVVTHDIELAARMERQLRLVDGMLQPL
jgi:lipoprotein-releasing system ATP-binding protein